MKSVIYHAPETKGISNLEKPGVRLAGGWRLWLVFGTGVATNI